MFRKLTLTIKAARQLGWDETAPYLRYRVQLLTGILRLKTPPVSYDEAGAGAGPLTLPPFPIPGQQEYQILLGDDAETVIRQADQIVGREYALFGGNRYPLQLTLDAPLRHWTRQRGSQWQGTDIKLIWEPGRFGWGIGLARAFLLTGDRKYAGAFWDLTEEFLHANPPNLGPHWANGQEAALRLITLSLSAGVFQHSLHTTEERLILLAGAAAAHARRILATLDYARAQNNNHLLSEAAGLYAAAALLPGHPDSDEWQAQGWRWFHQGVQAQITEGGVYTQHSTNYLRLVLQLALFTRRVAAAKGREFPAESLTKLAAATEWLSTLLDPETGRVPNLGGNDGAYILPLTSRPYADFRPVLNAARTAFLGEPAKEEEMSLWLAGDPAQSRPDLPPPDALRLEGVDSWAYFQAARFERRPAHADQLHLDLWHRGENIALDPGVCHYNAAPPWDNPLDATAYHNTLTINTAPQMTKAGRFLWLDWAQAGVLDTGRDEARRLTWAVAEHDGYRKIGLTHRRTVSVEGDGWMVRDQVWPLEEGKKPKTVTLRLHWLLPDWPWEFENGILRLDGPQGEIALQVRCPETELAYSLVRAGEELLTGEEADPVRGWASPTYAEKIPALSLAVMMSVIPPVTVTTNWALGR